ncbi:hypothetical protein B7R21_16615 [Subtercola boreus]|uniref:Uncharacterized protein n=1 Tax=Subtercola boreus TaxID=120213 RepID=A0A3E0VBA2_9MICO|nr:hypothetical protein [Subtercola boreus]RFA07142.1 hypothetical protein B7R21_16615 [Subtercola boreus]
MFLSDRDPIDFPAPETISSAAERFQSPIIEMLQQAALTELGVGTVSSSANGGPTTVESVAISYTLWRNPANRDDPANLADLTEKMRASLEVTPVKPLPEWMIERVKLMRYPTLWEAVLTTRPNDGAWQTPESVLVDHVNHVLGNTFRDERVVGGFPGELDAPVTKRHIEHAPVVLDSTVVSGMRIDTDTHVYAVGADLGDRIFTAVIAREHLPHLDIAFQTRPMGPANR